MWLCGTASLGFNPQSLKRERGKPEISLRSRFALAHPFLPSFPMESHCVAQDDLKLIGSSDPPASAPLVAGTTHTHHYAQPFPCILLAKANQKCSLDGVDGENSFTSWWELQPHPRTRIRKGPKLEPSIQSIYQGYRMVEISSVLSGI